MAQHRCCFSLITAHLDPTKPTPAGYMSTHAGYMSTHAGMPTQAKEVQGAISTLKHRSSSPAALPAPQVRNAPVRLSTPPVGCGQRCNRGQMRLWFDHGSALVLPLCNALQRSATHCSAPQRAALQRNAKQRNATHRGPVARAYRPPVTTVRETGTPFVCCLTQSSPASSAWGRCPWRWCGLSSSCRSQLPAPAAADTPRSQCRR